VSEHESPSIRRRRISTTFSNVRIELGYSLYFSVLLIFVLIECHLSYNINTNNNMRVTYILAIIIVVYNLVLGNYYSNTIEIKNSDIGFTRHGRDFLIIYF